MNTIQFASIFGWAALLSAIATIATLVTALLFFAFGDRFGKLNDATSVAQMLLMLPVGVVVFLLRPANVTGWALFATVVGMVGMLVTAVLQALLVFEVVEYEQTIAAVLTAGGGIGLWLIVSNVLALSGNVLPVGLMVSGIVAGVGYVLVAVGFYKGGQQHPLFYVGGFLIIVGYLVWAIWLGRLLQLGDLGQ